MNTIWILLLLAGDGQATIVERFLYESDCQVAAKAFKGQAIALARCVPIANPARKTALKVIA
jgi:hypothetical protein